MKKYWKDIESKNSNEEVRSIEKTSDENAFFDLFNEEIKDISASRRDFLKICGFSFAVSALSACQSKISKAVPYVIAPNEICLLYTSPSPRDRQKSRMPSSA